MSEINELNDFIEKPKYCDHCRSQIRWEYCVYYDEKSFCSMECCKKYIEENILK